MKTNYDTFVSFFQLNFKVLQDSIWKQLIAYTKREMLKSALGALVKMIKIETLYWEMVKSEEFNFLKVKTLLNSM